MAVRHNTLTVGTTAVNLTASVRDTLGTARDGRVTRTIRIENPTDSTGAAPVYLGGPGVSASDFGVVLDDGESITLALHADDEVWAVVETGTQDVRLLHLHV